MKTLTIVSEDKVGLLADISYILSKARVNIGAVNADVVGEKAIILLSLSDAEKGREALEASGYHVEEVDAMVIKLPDNPGELSKVTKKLSKEGVNISKVNTLFRDGSETILSLSVDKPKKARAVLKQHLVNKEQKF